MGSHDPFEYLKHKLWPKEKLGVKVPIWLPPTKIQKLPWFICMQVACHMFLKSSWRGVQLRFKPHFHRRFAKRSYKPPKLCKSQFHKFRDFQLGGPKTKWHLDVAPMTNHRSYYKGEGDDFPQVRAVVSFGNPCMPMVRPCTKWHAPKSRGETHLRVSQNQVTKSWDLEARSRLPTPKRGTGSSWEPRD